MVKKYYVPSLYNENLSFMHVGEEDFAALTHTKPHQRADYIIHFVAAGEGIYTTKNDKTETRNEISAGSAFAIYKYDSVYYHSNENNPLHYFWIGFNGDESEKILSYIGFSKNMPIVKIENINEVVNAFEKIFDACEISEKYPIFSAFYNLICVMRQNNVVSKHFFNENRDTIFSKSIEYIKSNIYQNIKVQDLTEYLHIDQSYFTKIFKKHFNMLPHIYIIKVRIQYAEYLLKTTDQSINEIVENLNFTDVYSFSKLFKKEFGLPPGQYRKKIREER